MYKLAARLETLRLNDRGASAVEYALIVGGIAIAVLAAINLLGGSLTDLFTRITNALKGL